MGSNSPQTKVMIKHYLECRRWLARGPLNDMTISEKDYLLCLGTYEGSPNIHLGPGELARIFEDVPASVSGVLKKMEGEGLVRLTKSSPDKRRVSIELTDGGRRVYEGLCRYLQQNIHDTPIDVDREAQFRNLPEHLEGLK